MRLIKNLLLSIIAFIANSEVIFYELRLLKALFGRIDGSDEEAGKIFMRIESFKLFGIQDPFSHPERAFNIKISRRLPFPKQRNTLEAALSCAVAIIDHSIYLTRQQYLGM